MLIFILVERRAPGDFECTLCDETLLFMNVLTSQSERQNNSEIQ